MATIHSIDTIVSDPAVRGGQPIIGGTNVRLADVIASYLYRGLSAEELAVNFALDLGQAHAALAYYYQHKAEIDAQMRADAAKAERLLAEFDAQGKLIRVESGGEAMRTFTAYIEFDPETKLYVGIVPGIPGAHTQAETLDKLQANLREVLELCLEEYGAESLKEILCTSPSP